MNKERTELVMQYKNEKIEKLESELGELKEKLERALDLLNDHGVCLVCGLREGHHKLQCPQRDR